jgi:hypothetical protein
MQEFQFTLEHVKGVDNIIADVLSRNTKATVDIDKPDCLPHQEWLACLWNSANDTHEDEYVLNEWCNAHLEAEEIIQIPQDKYDFIMQVHNAEVGHHGEIATIRKLEAITKPWEEMKQHVQLFIKQCDCCQKLDDRVPIRICKPFTLGSNEPMGCWQIDSVGPFEPDEKGNTYAVVLIDTFTRFMCLYPVPDASALEAVKVMIKHSGHYGMPKTVTTDNGTEYSNKLMIEATKLLGTQHEFTVAHQHQQNGIVERCNKEFNRYMRQILYDQQKKKEQWSDFLPFIQRIHNASICEATGYAPADLLFGGAINLNKVILTDDKEKNEIQSTYSEYMSKMLIHQDNMLQEAKLVQNKRDDKKKNKVIKEPITEYPSGSYVLLAWPITRMNPNGRPTKFDTLYRGPYKVIKHDDHGTYWLLNIVTGRPENLKSIHSIKPFYYDPTRTDPMTIALKDFKDEYLIESVITDNGKWKNKTQLAFEIKWIGYKETTTEPWANVRDNSVLHDYLRTHKHANMIPKKIVIDIDKLT